jgi:hypothetical protein
MSVTLLSYATKEYRLAQKLLNFTGKRNGADKIISYSRNDLTKTEFYSRYKSILDQPRGAGYWLWKPYFILETLKNMQENEILIYADAGLFIRKKLQPLIQLAANENGIALFYNYGKLSRYTKRDLFVEMKCDDPSYYNSPLIHANLQVYRKCPAAISFLEEVLSTCTTKELITDAPNSCGLPDLPGFIDHRHDQSVFSLLAHQKKLRIFMDPSQMRVVDMDFQYGKGDLPHEGPAYDSVIYMHRYKNRQMLYLSADILKKIFRRKKKKSQL